jgi:CheY-like chemotaxis protein
MGYVEQDSGPRAVLHGTDGAGRSLYRLTVVDDSNEFVSMVRDVLADQYVVTGIEPQSLDDIARTMPQVLIVDVHPRDRGKLNGWHVIEGAKEHDGLRHVPIILCSGQVGRNGDLERALDYPRVQLLPKPFTLDALDAVLARAMADRRAAYDEVAAD